MQYANYICPNCKSTCHMVYLDNLSKIYDFKCLNCNSYFKYVDLKKPKPENKIAYICDGHAKCSMEPGCFIREDPITWSDSICYHTLDPNHAVNGICYDPENHPERFTGFPEFEQLKYYERRPKEEL